MTIIVTMNNSFHYNCKHEKVLGLDLLVPIEQEVKLHYQQQQLHGTSIPFPYWTRLWASAVALASYIIRNNLLLRNKRVFEAGAGLALPSFIASKYALQVTCSDYLQETIDLMNRNIQHLSISNIEAKIYDWQKMSKGINADILLLSDVNYHPSSFPDLMNLIESFLSSKGKIILLSTPQRLAGKEFIHMIEPFIKSSETENIFMEGISTGISIFNLGNA